MKHKDALTQEIMASSKDVQGLGGLGRQGMKQGEARAEQEGVEIMEDFLLEGQTSFCVQVCGVGVGWVGKETGGVRAFKQGKLITFCLEK